MKKKAFFRSFSAGSFAIGLSLGAAATVALGASRMGSSVFPDVKPGSYYDLAIGEMYDLGIITGFGDGTFRPDDTLSRGQAAVMMKRLRDEILGIEAEIPERSSSSSGRRSSSSSSSSSSSLSTSSSSSSFSSTAANPAGKIRFTASTYTLEEDDGSMPINVVRTGGNKGSVGVEYKLVPGTAKAGEDYEAQEGTLSFSEGQTSTTFEVKVLNDALTEGNETFTLEISAPTGGAELIAPTTSTFTIEDDESGGSSSSAASSSGPEQGTFRFSAKEYSASEKGPSITVTVERTGGTKGSVAVDYSMTDGTAKNGTHYTKSSGTLSFGDGEKEKTFTITVIDNSQIGGSKNVNLALANPTGGSLLNENYKTALFTIADDEVGAFGSGSFRFTDDEYEVLESEGKVDITVSRQGGAASTATILYKTLDGSAKKGSDYKEAEGTLTFKPGETMKVFSIEIIKDLLSDGGETVNLTLSNPSGAALTSPSSAALYIY